MTRSVLDPACGSGHFLIAAANRIAKRLASVRASGGEPAPDEVRAALRDVIGRCVYGIDVNPMAVELCKVSLWMEAVEPGRPLSFLEHRIVYGNALLGATPALLRQGVPDGAFNPIEEDDRNVAAQLKRRNRQEREGQQALSLFPLDVGQLAEPLAAAIATIDAIEDDTISAVERKEYLFRELTDSDESRRAHLAADAWCAAFFAVKGPEHPTITTNTVRQLAVDPSSVEVAVLQAIHELAGHHRFLHPHLVFPEVFSTSDEPDAINAEAAWSGGFSLVLGNPPWETMSPDAKEFFAEHDPSIRFLKKSAQQAIIDELLNAPAIERSWARYRRDLLAGANFMKSSGRYRLFAPGNLGKGDFNVFRMFVESALLLAGPTGAAAQITPSGLYNGANSQAIRQELFDNWDLKLMVGLINKSERWFQGVDATTRFALYSARRGGPTTDFNVAFQITDDVTLAESVLHRISLTVEAVRAQSPDALAISETSGGADALIAAHIYASWPAFGDVASGAPTRRYAAEIHMGNDRDRFGDAATGLPLYEGRMIGQYDYRAKAYRSGRGRAAEWEPLEFGNAAKAIVPQWRVSERSIPGKLGDRHRRFRIAFCDVSAPRNERSLVAAIIPPGVVCGHTAPTLEFESEYSWAYLPWLAVANSLTIDFVLRKKVTLHVSLGILDSMPIARLSLRDPLLDRLAPLVLRLMCTGVELTPYWNQMVEYGWVQSVPNGSVPADALLEDAARAYARAEIDAVVAKHLYGLSRDDLEFVIGAFPTLERNEVRQHGEFRTRRLVLDCFDRL